MSPIHAMQIAERLYTQGYISYPRTETTQYPVNFDFRAVVSQQTRSLQWGELAKRLLNGDMKSAKKGVDVGDHPPEGQYTDIIDLVDKVDEEQLFFGGSNARVQECIYGKGKR